MCRRCTERLWDWLNAILDDTLHLDSRILTDYRWDKPGGGGKISGSPALVRLDVAALTDDRSNPDVGRRTQYYEENQDQHAGHSIPYRVCSWARLFTEEQALSSPVATMAQAVGVLTAWWPTLVAQLWIDDFYNDIGEIRRIINRANGAERPRYAGSCLTVDCDGDLVKYPGSDDLTCRECARRYDLHDRVRVEMQRRREQAMPDPTPTAT